MSHIWIVLWLILPIALVIILLRFVMKKRKRVFRDKLSDYFIQIKHETDISKRFQKHLVHQWVIIDNVVRKLLVISHNGELRHDLYSLDDVRTITVLYIQDSVSQHNGDKAEIMITHIGLELSFENKIEGKFLTVYDHTEHNIYERKEYEQEALKLSESILQFKSELKSERQLQA